MALVVLCIFAVLMSAAVILTARKIVFTSAPAEAVDFADVPFDASRYRAMQRLFSDSDWNFLASTVRSPKALRAARAERKRLFRRYLTNLETDFSRLHASARALLVDAPEDRPELAQAVMAQQLAFRRAMLETRMRLVAPVLGNATEGVGRMLDLAEGMLATGRQAIGIEAAA